MRSSAKHPILNIYYNYGQILYLFLKFLKSLAMFQIPNYNICTSSTRTTPMQSFLRHLRPLQLVIQSSQCPTKSTPMSQYHTNQAAFPSYNPPQQNQESDCLMIVIEMQRTSKEDITKQACFLAFFEALFGRMYFPSEPCMVGVS